MHNPPSDDNNWELPDANYRGPIWPGRVLEDNRMTGAEALDRKCSEMEHKNSWYRS